jgi:hypothetical protein
MSFASRLWRGLPLLAAVLMTPASNAATACPEPGSKAWKNTSGAATNIRTLALSKGCPLECAPNQPEAAKGSEREAHAPLPLSIVTSAEDVADWHADIFERLRGEHFEDGLVRYCGIARSTPVRPL